MYKRKNYRRLDVTLDQRSVDYLRGLGEGNLSHGIRIAVAQSAGWALTELDEAKRAPRNVAAKRLTKAAPSPQPAADSPSSSTA